MRPPETDTNPLSETLGVWREARDERGAAANRHAAATMSMERSILIAVGPPNESRLSCGALKKDSFLNLRARRQLQALVRQHAANRDVKRRARLLSPSPVHRLPQCRLDLEWKSRERHRDVCQSAPRL